MAIAKLINCHQCTSYVNEVLVHPLQALLRISACLIQPFLTTLSVVLEGDNHCRQPVVSKIFCHMLWSGHITTVATTGPYDHNGKRPISLVSGINDIGRYLLIICRVIPQVYIGTAIAVATIGFGANPLPLSLSVNIQW